MDRINSGHPLIPDSNCYHSSLPPPLCLQLRPRCLPPGALHLPGGCPHSASAAAHARIAASRLRASLTLSHPPFHPHCSKLSSVRAMVEAYTFAKARGRCVGLRRFAERCGMGKSAFSEAVARSRTGEPLCVRVGRPTALPPSFEVRVCGAWVHVCAGTWR